MHSSTNNVLTSCQEKAKSAIQQWLIAPDQPEYILLGGAGMGKSFLLEQVLSNLQELKDIAELVGAELKVHGIEKTATTNKAAAVIGGSTIFKLLGITVYSDFKTGETKLTTKNAKGIGNTLIVVDESSMVSRDVLKAIRQLCTNCKILYIGDRYQLLPVGETTSPVFDDNIPMVELLTPVRQDINSHLYKTLTDIRKWVINGGAAPNIYEGEGLRYINDTGLVEFVNSMTEEDKMITFTNNGSIQFNEFARFKLGLTADFFSEGEMVICNSTVINSKNSRVLLYTDGQYKISQIGPEKSHYDLFNYREVLLDNIPAKVVTNPLQFKAVLKRLKQKKDWRTYFNLSESFADIRSAFAITAHKSQGSTYNRVLVNLTNFKRCTDPDMLARLLYVSISRAKYEVYLYGSL